MLSAYRDKINTFLQSFYSDNEIDSIYGGFTKQKFKDRKDEHIRNKKFTCDESWVMLSVNKIKITIPEENTIPIETYKDRVDKTEQYLINELDRIYGLKCKNDRHKKDNTISQLGGTGIHCNVGDVNKLYVFYKLKSKSEPKPTISTPKPSIKKPTTNSKK